MSTELGFPSSGATPCELKLRLSLPLLNQILVPISSPGLRACAGGADAIQAAASAAMQARILTG